MGFTKLDERIIQSSIMAESPETFKVWITLLALCKEDGIAECSARYLESVCRIPIDKIVAAIEILSSPDDLSRSINDDGRRVERVDGGYKIINYLKYRTESLKSAEAERKRLYREQKKCPDKSVQCPDSSASASASEEIKKLTWRESLEVYQKESSDAWDALMANQEWIKERKRYHPSLDIKLSMEKAYNDFWGTEAGWKHKKQSRAKTIDWDATFKNALSMKANQVWEQKQNNVKSFGRQDITIRELKEQAERIDLSCSTGFFDHKLLS